MVNGRLATTRHEKSHNACLSLPPPCLRAPGRKVESLKYKLERVEASTEELRAQCEQHILVSLRGFPLWRVVTWGGEGEGLCKT